MSGMSPAFRAAARGAAFLDDRLGPDWWECIDVDQLNMHRTDRCVIGQWAEAEIGDDADYRRGLKELGVGWFGVGHLGFCTTSETNLKDLDMAWREILLYRDHVAEGDRS